MEHHQTTSPGSDTPWIFEPSGDGLYRVVNVQGVVLAERCVSEEAALFAAAPDLLQACRLALAAFPPPYADRGAPGALQRAIARAEGR